MKTDKDLLRLIGAGSDTPPHVACRCFAADLRRVYEAGKEELRQQLAAMTAERDKAKAMPMRYRRMEFNAQLQDENESLRQQLAAAIAACKMKDGGIAALLERHEIDNEGMPMLRWFSPAEIALRVTEAKQALAIQPDDSALKAWLGEPVARTLKRIVEEQYQPKFGMVARTYAELPKGSYPDTWQELDELYSPKGLK